MLLINTLLRDTKDTLLVNSSAGVEAIPILKSWAVIPSSFVFFYFYQRVSKSMSKKHLFLLTTWGSSSSTCCTPFSSFRPRRC